jgi:hypothetical protein
MLIVALMGIGMMKVAQHNAVVMKGYSLGEQTRNIHTARTDLAWLEAEVTGMGSPTYLLEHADEENLKLVAWSQVEPLGVLELGYAETVSAVTLSFKEERAAYSRRFASPTKIANRFWGSIPALRHRYAMSRTWSRTVVARLGEMLRVSRGKVRLREVMRGRMEPNNELC